MKSDIEGVEIAIISGMKSTIGKQHPLLPVEVFDSALRAQGSSSEEILKILSSFGYRLFVFSKYDGQPLPLEDVPQESENVLAVPDSRRGYHG